MSYDYGMLIKCLTNWLLSAMLARVNTRPNTDRATAVAGLAGFCERDRLGNKYSFRGVINSGNR